MRAKNSKRLVIDTDVARASGGEDATDTRSINCRDFLKAVLSLSYRVVITPKISAEWKEHRSSFALEWRTSMYARRRVVRIDPPEDNTLQDKITTTTSDKDKNEVMQKDFHLLAAALVTDKTVISLDETVRTLFARASQRIGEIRDIIWVNPERTEEQPITWLKNDALPDAHRQLSTFPAQ